MQREAHAGPNLTRRTFLYGAAAAVGAASATGLYASEGERHWLTVERRTIAIRNLPTAFHGFTIAQLSDFHFHNFDEAWFVHHAVEKVNRLKPDMVALTGDYITALGTPIDTLTKDANQCAEILSRIECPLRYCTLGNHDVVDTAMVLTALRSHGLKVLDNAYEAIEIKGDRLWACGIADASFSLPDLKLALPKDRGNAPAVLLGHEPDFADVLTAENNVDLFLAGHTHGGQIRIPLVPPSFLPEYGRKYLEGHFQLASGTQLYVNRGLGTVHLPMRFRCPPELTLMTLQPA